MASKIAKKLEGIVDREVVESVSKLSPSKQIDELRKYSENLPSGETLTALQAILVEMMEEERSYVSLEPKKLFVPDEYDVLLNDINDADLDKIGNKLGVQRLSPYSGSAPEFPIEGIIYGPGLRCFVPLVVSKRGVSIVVLFLYDSGSPNTHLREDTLKALGFVENTPDEADIVIFGATITAYLSRAHFENVDLLGQDFMRLHWTELILNFKHLSVVLKRSD